MSIYRHKQGARLAEAAVCNGMIFLAGQVPENTEADAQAVKEWLAGLQVHVNLIPYNPPPDTASVPGFRGQPLRASSPTRLAEFLADLKAAGYKATRRHSLGSDIQAACGQLAETPATMQIPRI